MEGCHPSQFGSFDGDCFIIASKGPLPRGLSGKCRPVALRSLRRPLTHPSALNIQFPAHVPISNQCCTVGPRASEHAHDDIAAPHVLRAPNPVISIPYFRVQKGRGTSLKPCATRPCRQSSTLGASRFATGPQTPLKGLSRLSRSSAATTAAAPPPRRRRARPPPLAAAHAADHGPRRHQPATRGGLATLWRRRGAVRPHRASCRCARRSAPQRGVVEPGALPAASGPCGQRTRREQAARPARRRGRLALTGPASVIVLTCFMSYHNVRCDCIGQSRSESSPSQVRVHRGAPHGRRHAWRHAATKPLDHLCPTALPRFSSTFRGPGWDRGPGRRAGPGALEPALRAFRAALAGRARAAAARAAGQAVRDGPDSDSAGPGPHRPGPAGPTPPG
jgi:hypothetical protein